MTETTDSVSPDEAFALLGNETRLAVLRVLGEADEPLPFSALHDAVEMRDSGQFNYHLERLVDHFVLKNDSGYRLAPAGRRVVEAVLSGAVTETPQFGRTVVEESCMHCDAPIEADWSGTSVAMYCTECAGMYGEVHDDDVGGQPAERGYLGRLPLPPAGLRDRSPTEALHAAWTWANLEILALGTGICPRCSARVEHDLYVCQTHDAADGICSACDRRHEVGLGFTCTNCILDTGGSVALGLIATTELLDLLTDHGLNPVAPDSIAAVDRAQSRYEERVVATDPFEGEFTFAVGDDQLVLTVDESLTVHDVER